MIQRSISIDLRSLAAFRIGLGLVLLWDLSMSFASVEAFYSNEGFLPLGILDRFRESPWMWSLHTWNGSTEWQTLLLVIHAASAICLLIGWQTKIATIVCWGLLCSIQARNPVILHSGDVAMRLFCFWGMFLPLGQRWSVDARRNRGIPLPRIECSAATLAILIQLGLIYWGSAIAKNGVEWLRDGTAVYYALSLDQFVTPAGRGLLSYPRVCQLMTFSTWWLEAIGPCLIFAPFRTSTVRLTVVAAFWLLHIGLWICLRLGPFPLTMMSAWLLCIPGEFWDRLHGQKQTNGESYESETRRSSGHRTTQIVATICLSYICLWNLRGLKIGGSTAWLPQSLNPIGYVLHVHQYWPMFAPRPPTDDGWFVMEAHLADGSRVDLLHHGAPINFDKPAQISAEFKDSKWQKVTVNLWRSIYSDIRGPFGNYLAFRWNGNHAPPHQIIGWTLWFMRENTPPINQPPIPVQKIELSTAGSM